MTDIITLPTIAEVASMPRADLIATYNHFASTAGQNPVKRFETRAAGIKRLTTIAEALRARGVTQPAAPGRVPRRRDEGRGACGCEDADGPGPGRGDRRQED
jgi:hypothetical protein